mgnify:CR=1 FL=1
MTALLTIIVLVFILVAIWQMVKIFDLAQAKNDNIPGVATDKDNTINGYLMMGFLAFIYIITIVCFVKWGDLPLMSNSAAEHGQTIDNLMIISMVIIFIVQTITQFLLHYFAFKYKGEKGRKALFYADNNKLEFIWTIIPVIVLAGLILWGLFTWNDIMNVDEDEDPMIVELYAQQFNWTARYGGADNVFKSRLPKPVRIGSLDDVDEAHKSFMTIILEPLINQLKSVEANANSEFSTALCRVLQTALSRPLLPRAAAYWPPG